MDIEKQAARLGMDKEEFKELLCLFVQTSVAELSDLQVAINAGDHQRAKRLLHSFKGASANLGLTELAGRILSLQNLVHSDPCQFPDQIRELTRKVRELENLLTAS
ncbi:MAG: Hpt domain-containing protein [Desulfosalsimonas sp.]